MSHDMTISDRAAENKDCECGGEIEVTHPAENANGANSLPGAVVSCTECGEEDTHWY